MDVMILDELMGEAEPVGSVRFHTARITARELIRARAELQVEQMREACLPKSIARTPDGTADPRGGRGFGGVMFGIDEEDTGRRIERLLAAAERGFEQGRYFLLLDDRQVEHLEEEFELGHSSSATFLLLTPLKGG